MGIKPSAAKEIRRLCRNRGKRWLPLRSQLIQMRNYRGHYNDQRGLASHVPIFILTLCKATGAAPRSKRRRTTPRLIPMISWCPKTRIAEGELVETRGWTQVAVVKPNGRWHFTKEPTAPFAKDQPSET
jgi:hypothetical protein